MLSFVMLLDTQEEKSKFQKLYEKYDNLMMYIALSRLSNNKALAEEAIQDAWLYVVKHFDKVGAVDSPQTKQYLCLIAQGFAIDKYRKEKRLVPFENDSFVFENELDDNAFSSYDQIDLKLAINMLDDESKNYIYLTYVYGYKSAEIADMYGIKPELVRKRIQFAKQKIKKSLED